MIQIIPSYYHSFSCLAASCPESCCKLWEIDVDSETQKLYNSIPGPLGDRLRSALTPCPDGSVILTQVCGSCALLDDDGLCAAQKALGPNAVSKTCREFPRMVQDYGDFTELDLELSCPEAARLILTEPVRSPEIRQLPGGEEPDYDGELMELLRRSRDDALSLLDSDMELRQVLALLLFFAAHTQAEIDGNDPVPFSPEAILTAANNHARESDVADLVKFYENLELLTESWQELLANPAPARWFPELRAFARYELNRYWLHAVSDFDLLPRVKMVIAAVVLLAHLEGDPVRLATLYSKEIDDDPDNIDALLEAAYAARPFTDDRLLGYLLRS